MDLYIAQPTNQYKQYILLFAYVVHICVSLSYVPNYLMRLYLVSPLNSHIYRQDRLYLRNKNCAIFLRYQVCSDRKKQNIIGFKNFVKSSKAPYENNQLNLPNFKFLAKLSLDIARRYDVDHFQVWNLNWTLVYKESLTTRSSVYSGEVMSLKRSNLHAWVWQRPRNLRLCPRINSL